ncbi:hypothetical protein [Actinoplanes sp. HUAS TT8]|uniref:hypothetical protein n=1 Tax=Actinoplanes sp. HUAS TT8 TaxID=3447453 RepID=UPI003F525F99
MNRLYNQLQRASSDASDALAYTQSNCHISFTGAGLIMYFAGPQDHILDQVETALTRLRDLSGSAGTEINKAQIMYQHTDQAAAAAIDTIGNGVSDPAALRALTSPTRGDVESSRAAFADVEEPVTCLRSPEYAVPIEMWSLNPLADLVSPTAWLRQVCISLFGKDPFEFWTSKLAGEWQAFVYAGNAVAQAGAAADAIAHNLGGSATDVPTAWQGNASEGFQNFEVNLALNAAGLAGAAQRYSQAYMDTAEVVKKLYDLTAGLIMDLYDALIMVSGGMAAGTALIETAFGAVAGYGVAAYYSWIALDLYQVISDFYGAAEDAVKAISATVTGIQANFGVKDLPGIDAYHHPALG